MTGACITTVGLVLDIIGALLIWYFVVEVTLLDKDAYLKGKASLVLTDPKPEDIRAYKCRVVMSRIGIFLIILGFAFQVAGNYVP